MASRAIEHLLPSERLPKTHSSASARILKTLCMAWGCPITLIEEIRSKRLEAHCTDRTALSYCRRHINNRANGRIKVAKKDLKLIIIHSGPVSSSPDTVVFSRLLSCMWCRLHSQRFAQREKLDNVVAVTRTLLDLRVGVVSNVFNYCNHVLHPMPKSNDTTIIFMPYMYVSIVALHV